MDEQGYYSQANHGPYEVAEIGDLRLEEGSTLRGCKLAYATHGTLNAARDNAILVTTWYSGTSKIMEQLYIGPGRALDPEKYFVVVVNQLGNGLSTSPSNTPAPTGAARFPHVRIGDDVAAQHRLLTEKLGVTSLALVTGGSMGAQQTYEWAVRYPDMVKRAAPIAGTARATEHNAIWVGVVEDAMRNDPGFAGGWYKDAAQTHLGLRQHAKLFALYGWSSAFYAARGWEALGFSSVDDFLGAFLEGYFLPMDVNNLLCMAWKWRHGDVSRHAGGDLAAALGRITARVAVMPISTDLFFPPTVCEAEQKLIPNSVFRPIQSNGGHLSLFCVDPDFAPQVDRHLNELLALPA